MLHHVCSLDLIVSLAEHALISNQQTGQFGKLVVRFAYLSRLLQQWSDIKGASGPVFLAGFG